MIYIPGLVCFRGVAGFERFGYPIEWSLHGFGCCAALLVGAGLVFSRVVKLIEIPMKLSSSYLNS
jgi:hypothetical protein